MFLGVKKYLSGRCLFDFCVFRRIEISERKVACLFSTCFRRIEFLHKNKKAWNRPNDHVEILSKSCLFAFYAFYERKVACLFSMILKRIEISEWKMLVCFLGVQTYLSGRCLFAFYVFRRIEISEWKMLVCFLCF